MASQKIKLEKALFQEAINANLGIVQKLESSHLQLIYSLIIAVCILGF
jgi:hypothetical protein